MNSRTKSALIFLVCGLIPLVVGGSLGWSLWLLVLVPTTAVSGVALLLVVNNSGARPDAAGRSGEEPVTVPVTPAEPPYRETQLRDVPLPSSMAGYDFLFSATVWWRLLREQPGAADGQLSSLAAAAILDRARAITRQEDPGRSDFVRYLLEGALAAPGFDASARVTALAAHVTLVLAPADRDRLQELATLRKAEEAWEHQRQYERNKRAYLGDEVLRTPGSAVVWWLARHDDEVEKAVEMIGPLAQISAAANDAEVPEPFRRWVSPAGGLEGADPLGGWDHPDRAGESPATSLLQEPADPGDVMVGHLSTLLDDLGLVEHSDERTVLVHRIARSLEAASRSDAAQRIREDLLTQRSDAGDDLQDAAPDAAEPSPSPEPVPPTSPPDPAARAFGDMGERPQEPEGEASYYDSPPLPQDASRTPDEPSGPRPWPDWAWERN
ncbi:hypothetical protein [Streptomyces sp. NPDC048644]|uniref:hypothetical protein n=1 Tax=Streptomyces sp. NPDC048644 TaxID=3365582 RepID=UPI00371F1083